MFNINRLKANYVEPVDESVKHEIRAYSNPMNHSYFIEACQFCEKIDQDMFNINKGFYGGICESGGNEILVQESFTEWFESFKGILKKIIDFLHALLNKFLVAINMFISREKFIKDHKKDLNKFSDAHKFSMDIYTFTFDNNIPVSRAIYDSASLTSVDFIGTSEGDWADEKYKEMSLNNHLTDDDLWVDGTGKKSKQYKDEKVTDDIENRYKALKDELSDGEFYDRVRAYFLDLPKGSKIDSIDFSTELFEAFRDGQSSKDNHEFDYNDIMDAQIRFERYSKVKKELNKMKTEAEKEYKRVEKDVEKLYTKGKDGKFKMSVDDTELEYDSGSGAIARKYENYVRAVANMVHEVSNIHSIAFSARLDAYKDCFKQDKTILYKALYRILGTIGKDGKRSTSEGV